jgi:predicted DNA-binding protein YlxM (UPF0122 family)
MNIKKEDIKKGDKFWIHSSIGIVKEVEVMSNKKHITVKGIMHDGGYSLYGRRVEIDELYNTKELAVYELIKKLTKEKEKIEAKIEKLSIL